MNFIRIVVLAALVFAGRAHGVELSEPRFLQAKPVWPEGRAKERNLFVEFRATFQKPSRGAALVRLTGASLYRLCVNGEFAGHGPARAGQGVYRVDEWDIASRLKQGTNEVVIEVAGYNANSFYLLDQPSFLQAEIVANGKVLASTGGNSFKARVRPDRVQKVQRYSFQRPFTEFWRLPVSENVSAKCEIVDPRQLAPRRVPYPKFEVVHPQTNVMRGSVELGEPPANLWKDRSLTAVGPQLGGFAESELEVIPSIELQRLKTVTRGPAETRVRLPVNSFHLADFGTNLTGFIGATVVATKPTRLFFLFDELLTDGDVDWKRLTCVNIVGYELQPGTYKLETFEPYTLRYLKFVVLDGECDITESHLREYANPEADRASFKCSDPRLNEIFQAARQTFRQNAVDIFMDCPSRERAGWLCDSFFTARVARDLCGNNTVEKNFLENFAQPANFANLRDGMLPMCYPSDHYDGQFIPNWAMWFVVELEEYVARSGDIAFAERLRPRVLKLLDFLKGYENSDGLLEKLPGWAFIEWSAANSFGQDVNYPSCMLYAGTLDVAGRLYRLPHLREKAERVRTTIRKQSFDGEFFVDNALRKDGKLQITHNRTEVCQYFAFFFDVASPQTHSRLWSALAADFGPQRKQTRAYPEIHPANAFVGNQLRFELLSRYERKQQILDEAVGYWLYMAERTGTLWEHDAPHDSCNHGFASHASHVLIRDVLGLASLDTNRRVVRMHFGNVALDWCKGVVPTPDGPVRIEWKKAGEKLKHHVSAPRGYKVEVLN